MAPKAQAPNKLSLSDSLLKGSPTLRRQTPRPGGAQSPKAASFDRVKRRNPKMPTQVIVRVVGDRAQLQARECEVWVSSGMTLAELVVLVNGHAPHLKSW